MHAPPLPTRYLSWFVVVAALTVLVRVDLVRSASQQTPVQFGGAYSSLDGRRQKLVDDWVARFNEVTGRSFQAGDFYDSYVKLSTKTTFDAITHALRTTPLTDTSGRSLGDALQLIEHVDAVKGQVIGASGDRQFRMYVRLRESAQDTLLASQQFKRDADNTIFHKGYPINFRGQGGTPSIQISMSLDKRRADLDVDYRSSSFPSAMFNGHLTAANSDVRAGNNYARHNRKWDGFQNWWRSFFGMSLDSPTDDTGTPATPSARPSEPRAGKKSVDLMTEDFLRAWLIEGDVKAAMGYVSDRAYACLAEETDDPATFDRGMAPFVLMRRMKVAYDGLPRHDSLENLVAGVRLAKPGVQLIPQSHTQFAIYQVADDVAAMFDCQSRLAVGGARTAERVFGNYYGSVFYIRGSKKPVSLALLWARERGYLKIVSWQVEADEDDDSPPFATPAITELAHATADPTLVDAARDFLESWLIRKDYDKAFGYVSTKSYACYDLLREHDAPPSTSPADAGRLIRAGIERSGDKAGAVRHLDEIVWGAEPVHPAARILDHPYSRAFTLTSVPNATADLYSCEARAAGAEVKGDLPLEYGATFSMTIHFRTRGGEAPVMRTLWLKENGAWRIVAYDVEVP